MKTFLIVSAVASCLGVICNTVLLVLRIKWYVER